MSDFVNCPGKGVCPGAGLYFDADCALREYPALEPLLKGLALYFNHGYRPGHFLTAVLTNDLQEAFARADDRSLATMPQLAKLLYNHAPSVAYGSQQHFDEWQQRFEGGEEARP
jgi:hypothetical protein